MPQTRIGRLLYVLVLLTGFLLLGSSLFRKHKPTAINGPSTVFLTAPANTALAQAIDAGNIPTVKSLFLKRPDIKQVVDTNTGETPLLRAVHRGQLEVTRLLLAHGAAPQEAMSATVSGLYHGYSLGNGRLNRTNYEAIYKTLRAQDVALTPAQAVQMNDLAALQSAVKAGANVNSAERWDGTPLFYAVADGREAIARWLLAHGANASQPCRGKQTPLMAVSWGRNKAVGTRLAALLLAHGADPNARDDQGSTPLIYAAINDRSGAIVQWLLQHQARPETITEFPIFDKPSMMGGGVPIQIERYSGGIGTGTMWSRNGDTALLAAAKSGNIAAIRALLAHGDDVNRPNPSGMTPIFAALYGRQPEAVKLLLAQGARLKGRLGGNTTPLMLAAEVCPEAIGPLLARGANVNEQSPDGDTALNRAARYGNETAMTTLLRAGANVNAANHTGWTPLLWAAGVVPKSVPLLIASGANVNVSNRAGETPLMRAIYTDRLVSARALLAAHADPNIANAQGDTPLRMAQKRRGQAIIDLLLSAGASR